MALDPYQPCPCGGGKKIKFCCCKDIMSDLDRALSTIESEQRLAGLEQLDKLIAKHGPRAALMATKATTQLQLGEMDAAQKTIEVFLRECPDNPVALGQSALMDISQSNIAAGIDHLQSAIELVEDSMPLEVYETLGLMAQTLLSKGDLLGARSHLILQASIGGADDTSAASMLLRIHASPEAPLLLKQDIIFEVSKDATAWSKSLDEAERLAGRGAWRASLAKLTPLAEKYPQEPTLLKNIALLRGCLGDVVATTAAWRAYSAIEGLPLEDAVEAEATAQLLDSEVDDVTLDVVTISYKLDDADEVMEHLISDNRASQMPGDVRQLGSDDQPPPKGAFWLLDRPLPASGENITCDDIPLVLGEMYLFGRQTDREPRLELTAVRGDNFDAKLSAADALLGDLVQGEPNQEVTDQVSARRDALTWDWRFPDDTPAELKESLTAAQGRETILNRWAEVPLASIGGKLPSQVASDQAFRVPLLAAILLLDLADSLHRWGVDYNELREKLGLPPRKRIHPADVDVKTLPLVRLELLEEKKLDDDSLIHAYQRSARLGSSVAVRNLATEIISRESLADKVDLAETYELLSRTCGDPDEALVYLGKARDMAVKQGSSPAPYLLTELTMQLTRSNAEECQRIVTQLRASHMNEPGVAQMLFETLVRFGVISPDGSPVAPQSQQPAVAATTGQADGASELWTPDGGGSQSGGEEKSKLWVPGMD